MKPPTQVLREPVNHSTKWTGPLIPSNLSTTSALPTRPRRGLGPGPGPRATDRALLTWMLGFRPVVSIQEREVWLGTDLWFEGAGTAPLPWRPLTHQVPIKPSSVPTTPGSTRGGWILPFRQAPALPHPVCLQVPASGGPQGFPAQLLKIHTPLNERFQAGASEGSSRQQAGCSDCQGVRLRDQAGVRKGTTRVRAAEESLGPGRKPSGTHPGT